LVREKGKVRTHAGKNEYQRGGPEERKNESPKSFGAEKKKGPSSQPRRNRVGGVVYFEERRKKNKIKEFALRKGGKEWGEEKQGGQK